MNRRAAPKVNSTAVRSTEGSPVNRRAAPKVNPAARSAQGSPVNRLGRPQLLRWSRRRRVVTALLALLHLLFMQLAVASYRCPMAANLMSRAEAGQSSATAAATSTQIPCTEPMPARAMDPERPNLCQAHCLADAQANSTAEMALGLALSGPPTATFASAVSSRGRPQQQPLRRPDTAPPLAIQYCCWRI